MPKPLPRGLLMRDAAQADLPSIGDVVANAPDDATDWIWHDHGESRRLQTRDSAIQYYRRVICDPFSLIRVACVKNEIVALSVWRKTAFNQVGTAVPKAWRTKTWFDALNGILLAFEADYRNFCNPPQLRPDPSRASALNKAQRQRYGLPQDMAAFELVTLQVHSAWQGHGIGTEMIGWGMLEADKEDAFVLIRAEERGVRFYQSIGFEKTQGTSFWLDASGNAISAEQVKDGNIDWRKENGGISGSLLWWAPFWK